MPLDKTRTYAQVYNHEKAHFEQDGKLFDVGGNDLEPLETPPVPEKRGPGRPKRTSLPWGTR